MNKRNRLRIERKLSAYLHGQEFTRVKLRSSIVYASLRRRYCNDYRDNCRLEMRNKSHKAKLYTLVKKRKVIYLHIGALWDEGAVCGLGEWPKKWGSE